MERAAGLVTPPSQRLDSQCKHPTHPLTMKVVFRTQRQVRNMRRELGFSTDEVELIMVHVAAAFETPPGFSFICDKTVEARTQKSLKTRFARIVSGEVILFESAREEALGQIFGVFVAGLPL